MQYSETIRLYHHKTNDETEYLCSNNVKGTDAGSFDSKYIVRIDGNIKKDAELIVRENQKPIKTIQRHLTGIKKVIDSFKTL